MCRDRSKFESRGKKWWGGGQWRTAYGKSKDGHINKEYRNNYLINKH